AEDGIRDRNVTGVQTCALPICKNIKKQNAVELRRSMGYVIQQIGLMPHMTIKENIVLVGTLLKWSKERKDERAHELLKLVDMPRSEERRVGKGGETRWGGGGCE